MAKRTDSNQAAIVKRFRDLYCTVHSLHEVGNGCPDIVVGILGRNYLVEIKTATGELEESQIAWHAAWKGQVCVIRSEAEATALVNAVRMHGATGKR